MSQRHSKARRRKARFTKTATASLVLFLVNAVGVPGPTMPRRYFPLEEGNWWVFGGSEVLGEFEVVRRDGNTAVLRHQQILAGDGSVVYGPIYYWLVDNGNEIDIDLPAEGAVPY